MDKFICIHGHFYQPPRENPWLEDVELQDSAYPFHDWNRRITEECYRQNGTSRILGPDKKIIDIVNNYSSISFNFGPTLLSWLEAHTPEVYEKIIEADNESRKLFSGHGSALAQVYNHIIMPLANTRDKHTQVIWGIKDFERRFKRKPEGMWLAETAANTETLEVLAEHGIRFTILSPRQAKHIRKTGGRKWKEVKEDNLCTTMPYLCNLPSGKSINLFFYNGKTANEVAYGGLLHSGKNFADRLLGSFKDDGSASELVHIATDGESFGHHHRHGDMALAYCLYHIRTNGSAKITIYAEYLDKYPPTHEVQIHENSSWSCVHGVERWKSNCGCCANQSLSSKQQWREPLRNALDWLRDKLSEVYEQNAVKYCQDPWEARNEYIDVINDRTSENINNFINKTSGRELSEEDKSTFLKLMEMQRMALLMYTSCGWFFDNISGIETVQVMQYASRAVQLHEEITGSDMLGEFKAMLKKAPANVSGLNNGQDVFEAYVEPARIDLNRVAAHFALSSIFTESPSQKQQIYSYTATIDDYKTATAGAQILATGKVLIQSNIVYEKQRVDFATLHSGDHNLIAALCAPLPEQDFQQMRQELEDAFRKGDANEVMKQMSERFGENRYSIWHLFKDEQKRLLYKLLDNTWEEIDRFFRHIYEHNYAIMLMMRNMNMNLPKGLAGPAEFIVNKELCNLIQAEEMKLDRLRELTDEAEKLSLQLDQTTLRYKASAKINTLMAMFERTRDDIQLLITIDNVLNILYSFVPDMNLQTAQNLFFKILKETYPDMKAKADSNDKNALTWTEAFERIAGHLELNIK